MESREVRIRRNLFKRLQDHQEDKAISVADSELMVCTYVFIKLVEIVACTHDTTTLHASYMMQLYIISLLTVNLQL